MRLLLVEDDTRIAAPLVAALEEGGHRVTWATDGQGGLELARAGGFDTLILDVMLPGLDGFDLARTLRAEGVAVPILFLTARGDLADRVTGLDLGGDAYLVKPFALAELKATLRAATTSSAMMRLISTPIRADSTTMSPSTSAHSLSRTDK